MAATIVERSIAASMSMDRAADPLLLPPVTASGNIPASFWRSLRYFSLYRIAVAGLFLAIAMVTGGTATLAAQSLPLFVWTDVAYLAVAFVCLFVVERVERGFNLQLSLQVACDIIALTVLMHASGGAKSGLAFMLVVVVAAAALVGQGRLTLFYAALATVAVLIEQATRWFLHAANAEDFLGTALISTGFFATAVIARLLARRVVANEQLAHQRGLELANQIRINQQVIHDMEDGVLVVDTAGRIRLHNPQAEVLLAMEGIVCSDLATCSPALAEHIHRHGAVGESILNLPDSGKSLMVRIVPPEAGDSRLIFLQDLDRLQLQARQLKLAALGRLTANIAHEIRNPLASISNAAELLAEEQRADTRARLLRIIRDNTGRLNRLVGEVLELGRRDRSQPETIELGAFLDKFIDEYSLNDADAPRRIRVIVGEPVSICFDRSHLHRVIENLVTNALRYASDTDGAVRIEVATKPQNRPEFHIIDDGPGIAEEDRAKVFEPFFTTRGAGTGLGLYIAKELCEANGARLDLVASGPGAHFRIITKGGECPIEPIAGD